jgi:hypothetical protein
MMRNQLCIDLIKPDSARGGFIEKFAKPPVLWPNLKKQINGQKRELLP